ncbi:MAG TPA: hypothetical protein VHW26_03180 [Solirubrobacteraceae bacterium]|jgi:hypothetical protein|nr:hypothetical protein [Solirubrobacteraceae bacterium]
MGRFSRLHPRSRLADDALFGDGAARGDATVEFDVARDQSPDDPPAKPASAGPLPGTPNPAPPASATTAPPVAQATPAPPVPQAATTRLVPQGTAALPITKTPAANDAASPTPAHAGAPPPATPGPDPPPAAAPDLAPAKTGPTSYRDRARLRRRLRYLRRARELAFRDLGGFVFDAHRFNRRRDDIVAAKLTGLTGLDTELRSLETALDDRRELMLLHEPGISVCPRCATLHASDANFCSGCGLPRGGAALPLGPRAPLPPSDQTRPSHQPTAIVPPPSPSNDVSAPSGNQK